MYLLLQANEQKGPQSSIFWGWLFLSPLRRSETNTKGIENFPIYFPFEKADSNKRIVDLFWMPFRIIVSSVYMRHLCVCVRVRFQCSISKGEGKWKHTKQKTREICVSHYLFPSARCQHYKHLIKSKKVLRNREKRSRKLYEFRECYWLSDRVTRDACVESWKTCFHIACM